MARSFPYLAVTATLAVCSIAPAAAQAGDARRITSPSSAEAAVNRRPAITDSVTRFTLPNGLKVIVQSSKRVPLVSATLVYNVGSKNETPGQYGYAHLFEHLMLNGSAHWNQSAMRSLADLGATDINAVTTQDTTVFFETFPSSALERVLFLEADRMGFVGEALTPERVKREVGVVLSEKRLRGGQPYGSNDATIFADLYPTDHPYHHSVIGSEVDLNAVTVEDARRWFDTYYGPSNATLILAGDVTGDDARRLVERYFGGLKARFPIDRLLTRTVPLPGPVRRTVYEAVPRGRIYDNYIAPAVGSPTIASLDLTAQIMAAGARSRINRRLIEELGIAQSAYVTFDEGALSSRMGFVIDGIAPDDMARAETELDAIMAKYVAEGPTLQELESARSSRIQYLLGLQTSTSGKAFLWQRGAERFDGPNFADAYLQELRTATPDSVRRAVQSVYGRPGARLLVVPTPALQAKPGGYDLTNGPPPVGVPSPIAFPKTEQAQLSNGMKVVLVSRADSTMDAVLLRFDDAGIAGTSSRIAPIALDLLASQGTTPKQRGRVEQAETINGWISNALDLDHADLLMGWGRDTAAPGLSLLGTLLAQPDLSDAALAAVKKKHVDRLKAEGASGNSVAERAVMNAIFGKGHPYAASLSIAEDVKAVEAINVTDMQAWVRGHLRPDRATLYITAGADMATLKPLLEKAVQGWTNEGPAAPVEQVPPTQGTTKSSLTVINKPGATQTFILVGKALPPAPSQDSTDAVATWAANEVFGGNFTSRIGSNLRGAKGWSYGIGSSVYTMRNTRWWIVGGSVNRDRSGDSVAEISKEMRALTRDHPPEQAELDRMASTAVNRIAARLEGDADMLKAMADAVSSGLPYDDLVRQPARLRALTIDQVEGAAAALAEPGTVHWIIVGDWPQIRDQFKALNLGEPVEIDLPR